MRPDLLLLPSITLFTLVQAWPWPPALVNRGVEAVQGIDALFRRQIIGPTTALTTGSTRASTSTPKETGTSRTTTGGNSKATGSTDTASITGSSQGTATSGGSFPSGNSTSIEFDPRDPAGGISMITPAVFAGSQYYKIGDWVTFAWNYTSLSATPNAINVVATCTQNNHAYTLAMNQSYQATPSLLWDTGAYQSSALVPLLTNQYTLIVWDAAEAITAAPRAGYLGTFNQFRFGMYTPQPYTPFSSFQCPTCSGAMTANERLTLKFLFGMASITVLTFTWFAASFNVS